MPSIAEAIAEIFTVTGSRALTINEIVNEYNLRYHPTPLIDYDKIYGALYREWQNYNCVFWEDGTRPLKISFDERYYVPGGRICGP